MKPSRWMDVNTHTHDSLCYDFRIALKTKFPADLVTFTEEILNGKLHFLRSVVSYQCTPYIKKVVIRDTRTGKELNQGIGVPSKGEKF